MLKDKLREANQGEKEEHKRREEVSTRHTFNQPSYATRGTEGNHFHYPFSFYICVSKEMT